ncbi:hypothetical protein BDW02DRAFT_556746 [Decorospora gaudefroyi]|uniref:Multicopper oxidase n=1 Tax=Decorospora gaudefroyi TaxID=184978 RepID=A0A6A5K9W4_9PLEO|nr:hypothetical protein BDW02DRAFT_556746 [Decorospora gaudefroyi]
MLRTRLQNLEEEVGLLDSSADGDGVNSEFTGDEEQQWKDKHEATQHHEPQRRYTRNLSVALLLLCIVLVVIRQALARRDDGQTSTTTSARLRPEEDYILDAAWDFKAPATTREYTWVIADHDLNPDGVYRPMILINGTFPGPLIECNEGDEIVVHVHNQGINATSIHWHGLYQNSSNWMDGTVGVTQCPIPPGYSFTYRFNVSGQTGTYWYHSHMSMQASDGLVGPLIIHAKGSDAKKAIQKLPYAQDRIVMLSDHYYDLSSSLLVHYLSPGSENAEPVPPSALINGRNIRNCSALPTRTCTTTARTNALFALSSTTNTRLRILNVAAFAEFSLQIDEHAFDVTEVDGTDVHPQSIHRLNISPAQRYSIVVTPPAAPKNKGAYWMRARMLTHCFAYEEPELLEEVWGLLSYTTTTTTTTPQTTDWPQPIELECRDLNTSSLTPLRVLPAPPPTLYLNLRTSFQSRDWRLSRGYINEHSLRLNATRPVLYDFQLTTDPLVYGIPSPEEGNGEYTVVSILIQNFDDGAHPFHLHGYKFWVMDEGAGYPPSSASPSPSTHPSPPYAPEPSLANPNPLRRDTVTIPAYSWTRIQFVADNPGAWAFHCHVGWHAEAGLGMVFLVGGRDEVRDEDEGWRAEGRRLCDGYKNMKGGQ